MSRSFETGNSSIPPTANISSGKTSVWVTPVAVSSRSCCDPGIAEPAGANGPPVSSERSAVTRMPGIASSRIVPWRNRPGPSMATEPSATIA